MNWLEEIACKFAGKLTNTLVQVPIHPQVHSYHSVHQLVDTV